MGLSRGILNLLAEFGRLSAPILFPKSLTFGKYKIGRSLRMLLEADTSTSRAPLYRKKRVLYATLYRLQKEGLVRRKRIENEDFWTLTRHGEETVSDYGQEKKLTPDDKVRLFIFDIPESDKKKRDWLRRQLRMYGYEPLQKSVWWSNRPLPHDFFEELHELRIIEHIHMFGLGEQGTLREFKLSV